MLSKWRLRGSPAKDVDVEASGNPAEKPDEVGNAKLGTEDMRPGADFVDQDAELVDQDDELVDDEGRAIPPWTQQVTVRAVACGAAISALFVCMVLKQAPLKRALFVCMVLKQAFNILHRSGIQLKSTSAILFMLECTSAFLLH